MLQMELETKWQGTVRKQVTCPATDMPSKIQFDTRKQKLPVMPSLTETKH